MAKLTVAKAPTTQNLRPKSQAFQDDRAALALSAGCLALVLLVVALTNSFRAMPDDPPIFDPDIYLAMVAGPQSALSHVPPFEWRILTPWLVSWLSFFSLAPLKGFFVLTCLALWGNGWLIFKICQSLAVPRPLLAIPLFFSCHYASAFLLQNYMIVDPLCFFLVLLAFYALYTDRLLLYIVALGLGALNKETILAVGLAGLLYKPKNWQSWAGLGVAGGIFLGLRQIIMDSRYSFWGEATKIIGQRLGGNIGLQIFSLVGLSFGPLILTLLYQPRHTLAWLWQRRELSLYFLLIAAQVLIASQNARLVVYGLVLIIPLALVKLDLALQQFQWRTVFLYGFLLGAQIIFYAALWPYLIFWN